MNDAELARRLNDLCHMCEEKPRNAGHFLCQSCYDESRNGEDDSDDDEQDIAFDVPPENASYEYLLEWCKNRDKDDEKELMRVSICDTLPTHKCGKKEKGQCDICLENYKVRESMMTLPCFHTFHETCCRQWIKEKAVCPVCMTEVKP